MAQNPLDAIAPIQSSGATLDDIAPISLDDIAPVQKKKKGVKDHLFTPIPALAEMGHQAAEAIEGVKRPRPELPTEAPGLAQLLQDFVTAPVRGYRDAAAALPGAVSAFTEEPMATAKGFAAGTVEALSQSSPFDILSTLFGAPKALRSTKSVGRGLVTKAADIVEGYRDPQSAAFKKASKSATANVKSSLPDTMAGRVVPQGGVLQPAAHTGQSRLIKPGQGVVARTPGTMPQVRTPDAPSTWLQDAVREAMAELQKEPVNRAEKPAGLASAEDPPMPNLLSREGPGARIGTHGPGDSRIPDPGGNIGAAVESGRAAAGAAKRAAAEARKRREELQNLVEKTRAARKTKIDAAASATLPKSETPPTSIVERSEAVAAEIQKGLEAEGRPPKAEPLPITPVESVTAAVEAIQERVAPVAKVPDTPVTPLSAVAPAPVAAAAGVAGEGTLPTTATAGTPGAAKPSSSTPATRVAADGKKAALSAQLKEKVDAATTVEAAAKLRDELMKQSRARGLKPEKAQIYTNAARLASIRVNELIKGTTAVTPEVLPEIRRFDPTTATPDLPSAVRPEVPVAPKPEPVAPIAPAQAAGMKSLSEFVEMTPEEFRALPREQAQQLMTDYAEYAKGFEKGRVTEAPADPAAIAAIQAGVGKVEPTPVAATPATSPAPVPDVPPTPAPRSSVGSPESMGAEQLVKMAEEAGAGPPPPGVDPVLHANMFALGTEAAAQFKARGTLDPRVVDALRRYYGSEKTAQILGIDRGRVETISGAPHRRRPMTMVMSEMDQRYRFLMDDPKGFMRNEALLAMAGAAAGGLVGGMIDGEDALENLAWTVSGALIGGYGASRGFQGAGGKKPQPGKVVKTGLNQLAELDTANLLAGPAVIKTSLGALGGIALAYIELISLGKYKQARSLAQYMHKEAARDYYKMLTAPTASLPRVGLYTQTMAQKAGIASAHTRFGNSVKQISAFVLRPFIAGDVVGTKALARAGISKAEAQRMMLVGEPTTWQGQAALKLFESNLAFRLLVKFPRVRIGSLERGIEYTPGLNQALNLRHDHGTPGIRLNKQDKLTRDQLKVRGKLGAGAMILGGAYGYYADPSLAEAGMVSSLAGPAFLPVAASMAAGKAYRKKGAISSLSEASLNIANQIPQIGEADLRPQRIAQRMVPLRPLFRALGWNEE